MRNLVGSIFSSTALALCLAAGTTQVQAHHSFAAEFDANAPGELTGVITEVRFSNPHVRYRVAVTAADGTVEDWEIQVGSVTALRPQGWLADSIKVGDTVSVTGTLGRNNAKKITGTGIEVANGRKFGAAAITADAPRVDRNAVNASPDINYARAQINPDHPFDISGPWRNSYKFRTTVDDLEPKPTPYTEEGRILREANTKYDDPALRCIALGLPRLFGNPYNMDIYDAGDEYVFTYVEHNAVRHIWMDGRTPPEYTVPTANGYSVGHWEGNDLVIETTHLLPGWLDGSGLPMSGEGTRTVERYVFQDDHLAMDRTMTIFDPLYTQPLTRVRGSAREANLDVSEQESCDPAGYYTDLLDADLLEKYLKP